MNELKITLFQINLKWENKKENLSHISKLFDHLTKPTDIIILPEMFTTGFTINTLQNFEQINGETVNWMKQNAVKLNSLIIGSIIIEDKGQYFNRLICAFPDAKIQYYDKAHLFRMAKENDSFTSGKQKLIINYKNWKICPLICYDLRFPVWSRNANNIYDLLVYIANWPAKRNDQWTKLLFARAIENQAYVAGVNRVGIDGNNIEYAGNSALIHPNGELLKPGFSNKKEILTYTILKNDLENYRNSFPVYLDADDFEIK